MVIFFDLALNINMKILLRTLAINFLRKKRAESYFIEVYRYASVCVLLYGNGILSTSVAVNQQHFLFTSIHFVNIAQWFFCVWQLWALSVATYMYKFMCYCESIFVDVKSMEDFFVAKHKLMQTWRRKFCTFIHVDIKRNVKCNECLLNTNMKWWWLMTKRK